jgi:hypothetical protein
LRTGPHCVNALQYISPTQHRPALPHALIHHALAVRRPRALLREQPLRLGEYQLRVRVLRRIEVHGEYAHTHAAAGYNIRLTGQASIAIIRRVDARGHWIDVLPVEQTRGLVEHSDVRVRIPGQPGLNNGRHGAVHQRGNVDVHTVAKRQHRLTLGRVLNKRTNNLIRNIRSQRSRMRSARHVEIRHSGVRRTQRHPRNTPRHRGKRSAHGPTEPHDESAQVGPVVGPAEEQVRGLVPLGVVPREHVVERDESTGRRRAVVVPYILVCRVAADGGAASGHNAVLRGDGEVCGFGPDDGAAFAGLLLRGGDDEDCVVLGTLSRRASMGGLTFVAAGFEQLVQLAQVAAAEAVVVAHEDLQR